MPKSKTKRASSRVRISFLTAFGAATVLALTGCSDRVDEELLNEINTQQNAAVIAYKNPADCAAHGAFSRETCEQAFIDSAKQSIETAPRYQTKAACEEVHGEGGCQENPWVAKTDKTPDEKEKTEHKQADASAPAGRGGGSSVFIYHGGGYYPTGNYYAPTSSGCVIARNSPGEPGVKSMPVFGTRAGGVSTPNGITGLQFREPMTVPRAAVSSPAVATFSNSNGAVYAITPKGGVAAVRGGSFSAVRPSTVIARGGFSVSGRAGGMSVGG